MKRIQVLATVAIVGIVIAILVVIDSNRSPPMPPVAIPTEKAPFAASVVGTGMTETGRGNVSIGTPLSGVVREVDVRVGDQVHAGDALFRIDDRDLQARLLVARADVGQARAALEKPRHRLDFLTRIQRLDRAAISIETVSNASDDVDAAAAALAAAQALVGQIQVDVERSVVRASAPGRILQVNVRPGEFATSGASAKPLLLLGDDSRMFLRVDIDENDAWRVRPDAPAVAFVRGNSRLSIPLRFEYIEPYVTPKTSLTGQSTERSDVRVLQVLYSFERGTLPVYLGQQMDAFIEAAPAGQAPPNGKH